MKKNYLFMLLLLLSACHGGAIIDSEAPIDGASQTDLTEPPAGLAARKPLAIPPKEKNIKNPATDTATTPAKAERVLTKEEKIAQIGTTKYVVRRYDAETMQQPYYVLVSRNINKMLKDTASIYNANANAVPTIYVSMPENENPSLSLPNLEYAEKVAKDIIKSSDSYKLTDDRYQATYILDTSLARREPTDSRPIILCRMVLKNRNNNEIGTWVESLSPVANDDQSWW